MKYFAKNLNSVGIEICSSTLFVHIVCSVKPTMVLYFLQGWSFPKGRETTNGLFDLKKGQQQFIGKNDTFYLHKKFNR